MWTIKWIFLAAIVSKSVFSSPLLPCPKGCTCRPSNVYYEQEFTCSSFDFLDNNKPLSSKFEFSIKKLILRDHGIITLNPRLKLLTNLEYLDISRNKIKKFPADIVPKSVKTLDVSNNEISYIPNDWTSLPIKLEILNITGNPLSCSCEALWLRDMFLSSYKNLLVDSVTCATPKEHAGKSWLKIKCKSDNEFFFSKMQADEPIEGSGIGDDGGMETSTNESDNSLGGDEEISTRSQVNQSLDLFDQNFGMDEELTVDYTKTSTSETIQTIETVTPVNGGDDYDYDEGSGLSGFTFDNGTVDENSINQTESKTSNVVVEDENIERTTVFPSNNSIAGNSVPACHFGCSTSSPLEKSNISRKVADPIISVIKAVDDFFNWHSKPEDTENKNKSSSTDEKEVEEKIEKINETSVDSPSPKVTNETKETPKTNETELLGEIDSVNEKESAVQSIDTQKSNSTFIFLGILVLVMICLIVYAVVKRISAKKKGRNRSNNGAVEEKPGEEMKLIKPLTLAENGSKQNGKSETVPLMNSQNGAKNHVENDKNQKTEPATPPGTPAEDEDDNVELREKPNDLLLTPETTRVTIKAGEIPDSIPKTPVLITRHIDSEGKVVTTPNLNQRSVN